MTDVLTLTEVVQGCAVAAQSSPNMTVSVGAGLVLVDNQAVGVAAGNVTISTAETEEDRQDAVVVDDTGAVSAIDGPVNDGSNVQPPDTTGFAVLAYVYVYSAAHPAFTGTITDAEIIDRRQFILLDQPANTLAFTFDDAALSNTDPGATVFGFNSATIASVTKAYVSYASFTASAHQWLIPSTGSGTPFTLRLWSRKNPGNYLELLVTALANHGTGGGTYAELTCTITKAATALTTVQLSTDVADTIMEYVGQSLPITAQNGTAALSGDVTMTNANQFYDGPNTGALTGTFLVTAYISALAGALNQTLTARLWDGSTSYAEASGLGGSVIGVTLTVAAVVTLSAQTLKISVASTNAGGTIKANPTSNSSGSNVAARISYVRLA